MQESFWEINFSIKFIILTKNLNVATVRKLIVTFPNYVILNRKIFVYILFQKVSQFLFQFVSNWISLFRIFCIIRS